MDPTIALVNKILLHYSPEYQHLKEVANKDVEKALLESIDRFLKEREDSPIVNEIKNNVFRDVRITEDNVNRVVDAFVSRSSDLQDMDKRSIDRILALFHEWTGLDGSRLERTIEVTPESIAQFDAQVPTMDISMPELYGTAANENGAPMQDAYASLETRLIPVEEFMQKKDFDEQKSFSYMSGVSYKTT